MLRYEFAFWPLHLLGVVFWIALLAVLVWALVSWLKRGNMPLAGYHPAPSPAQPSAIEILRQRYARGEINEETFHQMQERLEASTPPEQQQHF